MIEVSVKPGICGFDCTIRVSEEDAVITNIEIDTGCPHVKKMENEIQGLDGYAEVFEKFDTSKVYSAAAKHCRHLACPVPCAIVKGIEAAAGLALPKDVEIKIRRG